MSPVRRADMELDIPSERAFVGADLQHRVKKVGPCLQVPAAWIFHANLASVRGEKRRGAEGGVGPDAAQMPFRPGKVSSASRLPQDGDGRHPQGAVPAGSREQVAGIGRHAPESYLNIILVQEKIIEAAGWGDGCGRQPQYLKLLRPIYSRSMEVFGTSRSGMPMKFRRNAVSRRASAYSRSKGFTSISSGSAIGLRTASS